MSPILGIYASSQATTKLNNFSSIATVTVGSGGASSITFSSIPSTYTHLQIRILAQSNRAVYGVDEILINFNSDTGNNYALHTLYGDGASTASFAGTSTNKIETFRTLGTSTGGSYGINVLDILDYANTNKYKTTRILGGVDFNGTIAGYGGAISLNSGLWQNTSAITSIVITVAAGTLFTQYSSFALYGVK